MPETSSDGVALTTKAGYKHYEYQKDIKMLAIADDIPGERVKIANNQTTNVMTP